MEVEEVEEVSFSVSPFSLKPYQPYQSLMFWDNIFPLHFLFFSLFLKQILSLYAPLCVIGSLHLSPLPLLNPSIVSICHFSFSLCTCYGHGCQSKTDVIQAWNIVPVTLYPTSCVSPVMILFSLAPPPHSLSICAHSSPLCLHLFTAPASLFYLCLLVGDSMQTEGGKGVGVEGVVGWFVSLVLIVIN